VLASTDISKYHVPPAESNFQPRPLLPGLGSCKACSTRSAASWTMPALLLHQSRAFRTTCLLIYILQRFGAFEGMLVFVLRLIQRIFARQVGRPDSITHTLFQIAAFDKVMGQRFYCSRGGVPAPAEIGMTAFPSARP